MERAKSTLIFSPLDNTSDGTSHMRYSGTVGGFGSLANWTATQLSIDPYKAMLDEIKAGTRLPSGMSRNPNRYWLRVTPDALNQSLALGFVRILNP